MKRPRYVITTCGNAKSPVPAPAARFYTGSFVAKQAQAAAALRPTSGRIVLSNKHGFLFPDHVINEQYDSHWGYADTMTDEQLAKQVAALALRPGDVVVSLGGREYARQARLHFPPGVTVVWPAKHLPDQRIGYQSQLLNGIAKLGRLPSACTGCVFTTADTEVRKVSLYKTPKGK